MSEQQRSIRSASELGLRVEAMSDLSELIGAAFGLDGLILHERDLGPEFFRLSSGLAGELFQKFVNHRLPLCLVLPDFAAHGERFAELAFEHSRHSGVRFVHSEEEAWRWLLSV
ncbi:DUF4180 domain-containing protein [Deinococcus sp. KNUC1210]|uniref:DUF4180 domain-containing protein n=1 Tax=Deinococcus sp. KNUC1210 TaxID=2917691 RepID=UPI001EF091DC|nr:DUF4180 domain-containing protein [Deinococcus sp. KNUC1210]ULH16073.1 DUF4180 domain-containing protein [Deinococcus sp. KNUC1210]